ncbi:MAG: diaminopimelate decarboxylase [Defluviicoccus sp.]|nr:diaminopimelate decarboxylase [Defluviicoccus sp.]MDE0382701.1 diaminopimelate decarboxylase [Defluviicoccus sp.]
MNAFAYRDGRLHAEGVSLETVSEAYGTPVYVYSQAAMEDAYRELADALQGLGARICYAVKANGNVAVIRALARLGAGADVVSGGELARAVAAGIRPTDIVFSGVGKTRDEIAQALKAGTGQFNVESEAELAVLGEVAATLDLRADTAIRVNPDIAVDTADRIATGSYEHKFGVPIRDAARIYQLGSRAPGIRMVGVAAHIGSQILDLSSFESAFAVLAECVRELRRAGLAVERLDLGGGLGITYTDETAPSLAGFADIVRRTVGGLGCEITVEPGRRLVGNAGVLLSRVLYTKETPLRRFVIVDAAMNDLLRPTLYGAEHAVLPVAQPAAGRETRPVDVVGPVCETGDWLAREADLPILQEGDLVAIAGAGAYGAVMASFYNGRGLVGEVMVHNGAHAEIRPFQDPAALQALDRLPRWLE